MRIPKTEVAVNSRKLHSQLKLWPRLSSSALSTPVGFKSWPPKAAFILYRNNPIVYFSHLRIELNHVYSVPLGLSNRTRVCTGVLELEHTGKVDLFSGTFPDLFSSLSKDVQELSSRTHRLLEFPMQQAAGLFSPSKSRASPGSGENMCQASYRKPAQAWPLAKKSYTCCSTRLFLRNNHLYSSSIGIHLLPRR